MKNLIRSFLLVLPVLASAQDALYKSDNTKLLVKVQEIGNASIRYKLYDSPDRPSYIINKADVAMVIYQNGTHEVFTATSKQPPAYINEYLKDSIRTAKKEKLFSKLTQNKNVIFFNAIELLNSGIGVSYFREFYDGRFDLHVPFATSYNSPGLDNALNSFGASYGTKILQTHYDIGLGLYFNTRFKSRVTHFIGPLVRNAQYSGKLIYGIQHDTYYGNAEASFTMNETSLMLNNGFLYRISPQFNMMINIAFGKFVAREYAHDELAKGGYTTNEPTRSLALHAGFHLGYRF